MWRDTVFACRNFQATVCSLAFVLTGTILYNNSTVSYCVQNAGVLKIFSDNGQMFSL